MKRLVILLFVGLLASCATAPERIPTTQPAPPPNDETSAIDPLSALNTFLNVAAIIAADIARRTAEWP